MPANRRCYWGRGCKRKAQDDGYCNFHDALAFLETAERLTAKARQCIEAAMREEDERILEDKE